MIAFIPASLRKLALSAAILVAAFTWAFAWLKLHDYKIKSRVIEESKSEARKDVAKAKNSYTTSLSAARGVRSGYRRD